MRLVQTARAVMFCLHIVRGLVICTLIFPFCTRPRRLVHIQRWSVQLLAICGVTVDARGAPAAPLRAMIVANHVSWLDIFVLNSLQPCQFVAKSDVRNWPVLGYLAARAGTIFIERSRLRSLGRLVDALGTLLDGGSRVACFPEGTSAAQGSMLPFHPALFDAACRAAVPVLPVALAYYCPQGSLHRGAEYIGDTSFVQSVRDILAGPPISARVHFLTPIAPAGKERRALAHAARHAVAGALEQSGNR